MKKFLKLIVLATILTLSLTLFACNLIPKPEDEPIVYSINEDGASYTLKVFPDNTFELLNSRVNGINETAFTVKGEYSAGNEQYALSVTSYEMKSLTFGLPYETNLATAEELVTINENIGNISIINDDICMAGGTMLFKNGEKGSKDTVATVISLYKTYGYDYDFSCVVNGSLEGNFLVKYYADGSQDRIYLTNDMLGEHDFSTAGIKNVSITYAENKVYQAKVKVNESSSSPYFSLDTRIPINTTLENYRNDTNNRIYVSSSTVYLNDENVQITGFDTSKDEDITITITYLGYSEEKNITVYDPNNLKIEDFQINTSISVALGEELVFTGNIMKNDGSNTDVTEDVTVLEYNKDKIGPQMVSFIYQDITVKKVFYLYDETNKDIVLDIDVDNKNSQDNSYITYENGALDLSNHEIKLTMVDGSEQTANLTVNMFSKFDPDKFYGGNYQFVTISYTHTGYTYYTDVRINKAVE